jgi:3-ketosteroid 9alpha-monooxygenase subunit B
MDSVTHCPAGYHWLPVREVIAETPDACSFVFDIPAELAERFTPKPGQFLTFQLPVAGETIIRCYSLASSAVCDEAHKVTVKRVRDGRASNWLCDHVKAGDRLAVAPPAGLFVPADFDRDFLLFAGGSGITPVLAIAKTALWTGSGQVTLLYANRDERSVIFAAELAQLAHDYPHRLRVIHWLDSVQGVCRAAQMAALVAPYATADAFICGPEPFMQAAESALASLDVPAERVHLERFGATAPSQSTGSDGPAAAVEVLLDGASTQLDCAPGESLLAAMDRAGMNPPAACRAGACGACMCRLEEGEVAMAGNQVLDAKELAEGWILACQASPKSARLRVVFP